jgi:hypothetical protein
VQRFRQLIGTAATVVNPGQPPGRAAGLAGVGGPVQGR